MNTRTKSPLKSVDFRGFFFYYSGADFDSAEVISADISKSSSAISKFSNRYVYNVCLSFGSLIKKQLSVCTFLTGRSIKLKPSAESNCCEVGYLLVLNFSPFGFRILSVRMKE
jgi:hypothetical protein